MQRIVPKDGRGHTASVKFFGSVLTDETFLSPLRPPMANSRMDDIVFSSNGIEQVIDGLCDTSAPGFNEIPVKLFKIAKGYMGILLLPPVPVTL